MSDLLVNIYNLPPKMLEMLIVIRRGRDPYKIRFGNRSRASLTYTLTHLRKRHLVYDDRFEQAKVEAAERARRARKRRQKR
jgi:hypothetical protein